MNGPRKKALDDTEGLSEDTKSFMLQSEVTKLENHLEDKIKEHAATVSGMKEKISLLTQELHKRDSALADMSEHAARMEREIRDINSSLDKKSSELEVANAQLEALRLENRHLRETALNEQLTSTDELRLFESHLSDIQSSNAKAVAQLEEENRYLREEVGVLRHEISIIGVKDGTELKDVLRLSKTEELGGNVRTISQEVTTEDKLNALQAKFEATIQDYEQNIHMLKQENENLKLDLKMEQNEKANKVLGEASELPEGLYPLEISSERNQRLSLKRTQISDDSFASNDGLDLSHIFDALEMTQFESGRSSSRQSITADFISEEKKREEELQQLLDARISELQSKTEETLKLYRR